MALRLTVAADIADISRVLDAFDQFAATQALADRVRQRAGIALDEVLTNAVSHGGATAIEVRADISDGRLVIEVEDDSPPYDPTTADAPDLSSELAERGEGGLGVHLVMRMMDEVHYQRHDGKGVLTLVQRLKAE